jgi:hypothetical protein
MEDKMTKATSSKKMPSTVPLRRSNVNPRTAAKKSSVTGTAKRSVPSNDRKVDAQPTGKIATIATLLRRPKGASIDDLMRATGWQAHSLRGAISVAIKKKLGLKVASEKTGPVRLYRITDKAAG